MWIAITKDSTIIGLYTCVTDAVKQVKHMKEFRIFEVFPNSESSHLYLSKGV